MNVLKLLDKYALNDFPSGVKEYKNLGITHDHFQYEIFVFDEKKELDMIIEFEDNLVTIHHCSLNETRSNVLVQFYDIKIIKDEKWELTIMLSKIKEKKNQIYKDCAKNSLIDSFFCITRTKNGSDIFAGCWIKCAAFYLADTILAHHRLATSHEHILENIRAITSNKISEKFAIVNECIGTERSTPVLLERMCKSTIGFSEMIENNNRSKIIQAKNDYFLENSLLADSYFYLGYVNRDNLIKIKDSLVKKPDLIYVLKVAFDIENDQLTIQKQAKILQKAASEMFSNILAESE